MAVWMSLSQAEAVAQTDRQRLTDERLAGVDARLFAADMLDSSLPSSRAAAEAALTGTDTDFKNYVETGRVEAQQQDLRQILATLSSISGPTVQQEISRVLDTGDSSAMSAFIDSGWQQAQTQDDRATAWEAAEAPEGSTLKAAADEALRINTPDALSEFAATGAETARAHDRRREVYELTNSPLPSVAAGASEAIQVGTDTAIESFLRYGQFVAATQDTEKMDISQLVDVAVNEAAAASTANKLAWQQADRAARAAENAKHAAEISRDEAIQADAAQTRAGNAAQSAAQLAEQSAHVADQAVAASQEARIALQQTADALSRAASAAGRAQAAASAAHTAAANAASDASTARSARVAAQQARDAADSAQRSAQAYEFASQSAGHARAAGQAASSAAVNADAAAAAASEAANAAGVSEAAAAEARAGAARARDAAARARAAANEVDRLVQDIENLVAQAQQAAREAADHAEKSAEAAERAAWEAENAAGFSRSAGEYAAEARRAATAADDAITLAETTHNLAVTIGEQRYQTEKEFLRSQAADARAVQDAADAATAQERQRQQQLHETLSTLESPEAATQLDKQALTDAAVAAAQVGGPAVAGAAKTALTGGTEADLRQFAVSGYPAAVASDNRALLQQWWATDPNEDVRFDSGVYANAAPEVVDWFINDEVKKLRLPDLKEKAWALRDSQGDNTRAAADAALADGGYDALDTFVNDGGYANARYADQLQQAYYLVETGGPEVKAAAEAAVAGDRSMLNEFIMIEQYRRASLDSYRATHNAHIDSMIATGRNIANLSAEIAANAQAAYEYSQGSAQKAREYADAAARYADFAAQATQRAQGFATSAGESLAFAQQQQQRARNAAASAEADATQATTNADQATSYAIDARSFANGAAESAMSARASATAAGQDAALAAQAADEAYRIAVEKEINEQTELQAGLDAQRVDGEAPQQPSSLLEIIKHQIGQDALNLILDIIGVTDLLNCFKGSLSGCVWTAVGVLPIGKAAKIAKAAPALRKLVGKTDEIADALRQRNTLRAQQLDNIRSAPACAVATVVSAATPPTYRTAQHAPSASAAFLLVASLRCSVRSSAEHPFRGSSYYRLNATHVAGIQLHRHHLIAQEVIKSNRDVAKTMGQKGLNPSNAPSIQMTPEDHRQTESWGSRPKAQEYRELQAELFRKGDTDQIFQLEYDFLTQPQFEGRYDEALDEAIEYALKEGFITKSPSPRVNPHQLT